MHNTHIHTYPHTYIYIDIHIHRHTYIHTHTFIHTYIHRQTYIHTYIYICVYIHICVHIFTYIYTYIYIVVYVNIYIHIFLFGLKSIQKPWRLQRKAWSWRPYFNSNCREPQGTAVVIEAPSALGTREGRITFARKNGTRCWPHVESTSFSKIEGFERSFLTLW